MQTATLINSQTHPRIGDALAWLGGDLAADVAAHDPWPHSRFLSLSSGRQHYFALLTVLGASKQALDAALAPTPWSRMTDQPLSTKPLKSLFEKLTLPLGSRATYRALIDLISKDRLRILHSLEAVEHQQIELVARLPADLVLKSATRLLRNVNEVDLLLGCASLISEQDPIGAIKPMFKAPKRSVFWQQVLTALAASSQTPEPPRLDLPGGYNQLVTAKELKNTASRFGNCLMRYEEEVSSGDIAIILKDADPMLVFSVKPKIGGALFVDQVEGVQGRSPSRDELATLGQDLVGYGIQLCNPMERLQSFKAERAIRVLGRFAPENDPPRILQEAYDEMGALVGDLGWIKRLNSISAPCDEPVPLAVNQ